MDPHTLMPGIQARRLLAPREDLLWATSAGLQHFDVPGLNPDGTPSPGLLSRAVSGTVGAALMIAVPPEPGSDSGKSTPPDVVVVGKSVDDLAVGHGLQFREPGMWALTTGRLLRAVGIKQPEPEAKPKKKGFLSGVVEVGKIVADVVTSPTTKAGMETLAGEWQVVAEFPRAHIRAISVQERSTSLGRRPALRVQLADGSGFDFLLGARVPMAQFERMLALSHGAPE